MRTLFWFAALLCASIHAGAVDSFPLWPNGAPGALGSDDKDIPALTPYLPKESANGTAIVVLPGGGYGGLAAHEGREYALWLNDHGIAAFVLKYRLGSAGYRHPVPLQDAARALRLVRHRAGEWNVKPDRIGIMGSSAGGHLASTLLTRFDSGNPGAGDAVERQSSRPDFGILCYPVITMGEKTHAGSKRNLLGQDPSAELVRELSNELHVTGRTPPVFLFHTVEDKPVPVENSFAFAAALREHQVPFALQVYQRGVHGIGLGARQYDPASLHPWTANCIFWLKENEFIPR